MKVLSGVVIALAVLCFWQEYRLRQAQVETADLTVRLDDAIGQLRNEVERGKRIEQATIRLEQSDAIRRQELKRYERDLQALHDSDVEIGSSLDVCVPDAALRGLRSCPGSGQGDGPRH